MTDGVVRPSVHDSTTGGTYLRPKGTVVYLSTGPPSGLGVT